MIFVCGICGVYGFNDKQLIKSMTRIMEHRGPDDEGYYSDKNLELGFRRLSIIDLAGGHQPMSNEDGSVWIVFNGEIWNYRELRQELEAKGHRFATNADTESVIHAYEEYGFDCLQRLNGMFAFAIWDANKKQLFLARDRTGKKPLYYWQNEGVFLFASEIKALLAFPAVEPEVNFQALDGYLTFRFVPTPETMFKGVFSLPAAHAMTVDAAGIRCWRYWQLKENISTGTEAYFIARTREVIRQAVQERLISDVPIGIYLSGGIDSSAVLGFLRESSEVPLASFTIGFESEGCYNELPYAAEIARLYDTDHHEFIVKPRVLRDLSKILWHLEQPTAPEHYIAEYYLAELARKHVKVVLTGSGGDEAFATYEKYLLAKTQRAFECLPSPVRRLLASMAGRHAPFEFAPSLQSPLRFAEKTLEENYLAVNAVMDEDEKRLVVSEEVKSQVLADTPKRLAAQYFSAARKFDYLNQLRYADYANWFQYYVLQNFDKITMAHSLEGRVPLASHKLVEFSFTLPLNLLVKGFGKGGLRYLYLKSVKDKLPPPILARAKQGFQLPLKLWFDAELREYAEQRFGELKAHCNLFDDRAVHALVERIAAQKKWRSRQISKLMTLLAFSEWHRLFILGGSHRGKP